MRCKVCNHHWFVNEHDLARIHTLRGWWPTADMIRDAHGLRKRVKKS